MNDRLLQFSHCWGPFFYNQILWIHFRQAIIVIILCSENAIICIKSSGKIYSSTNKPRLLQVFQSTGIYSFGYLCLQMVLFFPAITFFLFHVSLLFQVHPYLSLHGFLFCFTLTETIGPSLGVLAVFLKAADIFFELFKHVAPGFFTARQPSSKPSAYGMG